MQINTNVNVGPSGDDSPALTIQRQMAAMQLAEYAESQNLVLLMQAMAACARREQSRLSAKLGAASAEVHMATAKAADLAEKEAILHQAISLSVRELKVEQTTSASRSKG